MGDTHKTMCKGIRIRNKLGKLSLFYKEKCCGSTFAWTPPHPLIFIQFPINKLMPSMQQYPSPPLSWSPPRLHFMTGASNTISSNSERSGLQSNMANFLIPNIYISKITNPTLISASFRRKNNYVLQSEHFFRYKIKTHDEKVILVLKSTRPNKADTSLKIESESCK